MASELTVTILRYAFLALIWFFVFLVVSAARRDLGLGKNYRAAPVDAVPEATHIAPPPTRPSQLVITAGGAGWRDDAAGGPPDYYWPR